MKIIPFLTLICSLTFMVSCNEQIDVVEETFDNGANKVVITYELVGDEKIKLAYKKFYPNGGLNIEGIYKNDKKHGKWNSYHENGAQWSSVVYTEGIREGESIVYYPTGEVNIRGQFKNDVASGVWSWYNKKGEVEKEINYSDLKIDRSK